ncbi:MAG TPA: alkaline phosphatase family protein [Steroidobacteraceae bacterium]|nr:alkaline phosphatase family protein [Steroidobacteraceae bacterium]
MHLPRPVAIALLGILAWAPPLAAAEPPHPKLIVTLVVDQYSADLFSEYRPTYDPKVQGLARLSGGVVFPHGHQGHAATETCPGHSTILTGARPARTGIVANDWQVTTLPRTDSGRESFAVYCVEQPGEKGSDARKKVISVDSLLVPTLGDRMKAHDPATRVAAIGGKDRAAVLLGGHDADLTLWWTDKGFVTYVGKEATIPKEISERVNAGVRSSYGQRTAPALPPQCAAKTQRVSVGLASVGTLAPTEANSRRWRATPMMDSFTVDAALAAVKALSLGQRKSIDLLAVSFSANDYVAHYFGTEGPEMCAIQSALDRSVGRLLAALDQTRVPYMVVLTADHGGLDIPERNGPRALPAAQRIRSDVFPASIGAAVGKELGLDGTVLLGGEDFANDVFLSPDVPADKRVAVIEAALRKYSAHPQVEKVFTRNELISALPPLTPVDEWTLLDRAKASFNPLRSGDLVVLLKPYVTIYQQPRNVDTDYIESHGSPWGYDRRVPIVFWWKGINGFEQPAAVETVDIAPTLASLIGLKVPASEFDGRVLQIVR